MSAYRPLLSDLYQVFTALDAPDAILDRIALALYGEEVPEGTCLTRDVLRWATALRAGQPEYQYVQEHVARRLLRKLGVSR